MDPLDVLDGVEPALDPRLVRHANDQVVVLVGERERRPDAAVELESVGVPEIVEVGIQGAIPVDKERPPARRVGGGGGRGHALAHRRRA